MMVDVIIPNYNGAQLLVPCLEALRRQTRRDFAITVVDDGSTDASLALLAEQYPEVTVLALGKNRGLVAALNIAISHTHAPYVVLLNNDTEADPQWFAYLMGTMERFPAYDFAASKLRLYDRRDTLHSAGDGYRADGVPFNRGVWETDHGQYDTVAEVWGPCAGAAAYQRAALEALAVDGSVFDQDLFMYCEDVDLNIRARLAGMRTVFEPRAVVYHRLSATGGGVLASYYCGRNFIAVWVKNMPTRLLRRYLGRFMLAQARITLAALVHFRGASARARLGGQIDGLRSLPVFLAKRRRRQNISDNDFARLLGDY